MRAETGTMKFENDWSGVFIRGDDSAYYSMILDLFIKALKDKIGLEELSSSMYMIGLENLSQTLNKSNHLTMTESQMKEIQEMKKFEDCIMKNEEIKNNPTNRKLHSKYLGISGDSGPGTYKGRPIWMYAESGYSGQKESYIEIPDNDE